MQNLEDYFDVDASDFCPIIVWVFARELTRYLSTASASQFRAVAAQAEEEFKAAAAERRPRAELRVALTQRLKARFGAQQPPLGLGLEDESVSRFVESTVGAFLDQDLLQAVRRFLANAKGSFGLFVSCSLDAHRQFVLAARGQTISLAFYPRLGIVLWGSEQVGGWLSKMLINCLDHFPFSVSKMCRQAAVKAAMETKDLFWDRSGN